MSGKVERCAECGASEQAFTAHGGEVRRIVHAYGCPGTNLDWLLYGDVWMLSE